MSVFNIEGSGGAIEYACAQVKVAPSLIVPLSDNGTQFERSPKEPCKDCSLNYYPCEGEKRIKELESTIIDLQSELARKKMSLTVACNRVEELEDKLAKCQDIAMGLGIKYNEQQDKLKIAVDCLQRRLDDEWNDDISDTLEQL